MHQKSPICFYQRNSKESQQEAGMVLGGTALLIPSLWLNLLQVQEMCHIHITIQPSRGCSLPLGKTCPLSLSL